MPKPTNSSKVLQVRLAISLNFNSSVFPRGMPSIFRLLARNQNRTGVPSQARIKGALMTKFNGPAAADRAPRRTLTPDPMMIWMVKERLGPCERLPAAWAVVHFRSPFLVTINRQLTRTMASRVVPARCIMRTVSAPALCISRLKVASAVRRTALFEVIQVTIGVRGAEYCTRITRRPAAAESVQEDTQLTQSRVMEVGRTRDRRRLSKIFQRFNSVRGLRLNPLSPGGTVENIHRAICQSPHNHRCSLVE